MLGSEKRLEDPIAQFRCDAMTGISHRDLDVVAGDSSVRPSAVLSAWTELRVVITIRPPDGIASREFAIRFERGLELRRIGSRQVQAAIEGCSST